MGREQGVAWRRVAGAAALAGCVGCGPSPWMEPASGPPECGPASEVGSDEQLLRFFRDRAATPPSSEVTGDLRASADLSLTPEMLGLAGCAACLPQLHIPGSRIHPGITAGSDGYEFQAGAEFRLLVEAVELEPGHTMTRVWVRPPCGTPCPEGLRRCPTDDVCYPDGERLCTACTDLPPERCACAGPDGTSLDTGSECVLFEPDSGAVRTGVCQSGSCRL